MKKKILWKFASLLGLVGFGVVSTASFIWANQPKAPAAMLAKK